MEPRITADVIWAAETGIRPLVGVLLERAISHATEVYPWLMALGQQGWPIVDTGYNRPDVARNKMADHLLANPDYTHLVMLDIDHQHPPNVVQQFVWAINEDPTRQVVGSLSFRRGQPYEPLIYRHDPKLDTFVAIQEWEVASVIEVDRMGTGSMCIARRVFEVCEWPWFAYSYPERDQYPTEDTYFCQLCQEHGIRLWCDTRIRNNHLGTAFVNEAIFRQYVSQFGEQAQEAPQEVNKWQE